MHPLRIILLSTLAFLQALSLSAQEAPIRYAFQVFQLNGSFSDKTSLENKIWSDSTAAWERIENDVTLFDKGEFRNGKDRLVMEPKGCFWNDRELTFEEGHQAALPEKKIKMIFSPNLIRKERELVRLKIASTLPYQFMKAREDGLFEVDEIMLPTGLDIEIKAHQDKEDSYEITYLELDLRSVNRRETLRGIALPIGKPILDEVEYRLKLTVREYRSYGILLRPKGSDSLIIIRFEVDDR